MPPTATPTTTALPEAGLCRAMLDAMPVPALLCVGDAIVAANEALCRLLGHPEDDLLQREPAHLVRADLAPALRRHVAQAQDERQQPPATELALCTRTGEERLVELNARRVACGPPGLPGLLLVTCQDLSDVRHVQASLLNAGQVLNQIIDNGPVPTFVIDREHRITHWNRACEHLTGRRFHEVAGMTDKGALFYAGSRPLLCDLIVDGVDADTLQRRYPGKVRASGVAEGAYEVEDFFPGLGGGGRWLFFTAAPLRDAQGGMIGAIETLQDVSDRHTAEEELTRHRNQLELLVSQRTAELDATHRDLAAFMENASVGILASAGGRIVRHNKTFAEMFACPPEGAVGRATMDFFCHPEDHAALGQRVYPLLSRGQSFQHEMMLCGLDGRRLWVQMIAYVSNANAPASGTWWILQDRSDVRRAQEELESNYERLKETNRMLEEAQNQLLQSEKMASIGQLAAGVAHEINNPVGFVNSNLHCLKRYVGDLLELVAAHETHAAGLPAAAREALDGLRRRIDLDYLREDVPALLGESVDGLERVRRIVQDLKDFSRIDSTDWEDADLNAGLDSTLNVVYNEVKYKAEVRKAYGQLPRVRCLAGQLNQVFMNLIVNAAHAITERGVITLRTGHCGGWVWVEVEDTGCGMSPELQLRVFEPFFTTKPVGKGTGLGLSLSFSIVQKHQGLIKLRSTPGEGSTFRVWIPVTPGSADHPRTPPA